MIHIPNLDGTGALAADPELWREVHGYLSVCAAEDLDYGDEEELAKHDFNFQVLSEEDLPLLGSLTTPEEFVRIDIYAGGESRCLVRIVYRTAVFSAPGELSDRLPFTPTGEVKLLRRMP